ncbi:CPCC family cysteine-rich protein [Streptomyces sp. NPDC090994]|uniref:CPCC family cysteine-rich protein n=1 Tax=Streptomyces sp. NPDC090994 TaxID=3365969 RepID=UPI0038080912
MPGSHGICPVCFWEDDGIQFRRPTVRPPSVRRGPRPLAHRQLGALLVAPHLLAPGPLMTTRVARPSSGSMTRPCRPYPQR